ncbi:MAG: hypothetical protein VKL59_24065 [Nostocaceae cyanobacterium]|nr:hypothetical protein [Nostocaceae cyanobacterium]
MSSKYNFSYIPKVKVSVHKLAERMFAFRQISRLDQQLFMSALLSKDTLEPSEQKLVDQVFEGLKNGWLRVVD